MADKKLLGIAILVIAVIAVIGAVAVFYTPSPSGEQVTLMFGFTPNVGYAPFYTAAAKGFYAEEGLNVSFQQKSGISSTSRTAYNGI